MPNLGAAQQAGKAVMQEAKQAANSVWVERLARFGFLTRGLVYIVIGVLALQLVIGAGGGVESPTSAVKLIGDQPAGRVLVIVVAIGLTGYALWGFVRAIFDPLGRGVSRKGLMARAGFFFSGLSYALLVYPIVLAILNMPAGDTGSGGVPSALAASPLRKVAVIAIAVIWLVAGGAQMVAAYRARFTRDLKLARMTPDQIQAVTWLGRFGYGARSLVFVTVGMLGLQTVFAGGAQADPTFDGALATLAHSVFGGILLGLVALGLIMFGVFSAACAKWSKISRGEPN